MRPHYYKKPKPETIKKWIGINRNKFSIEIFELERIINSGTADDFTKSMYKALVSGRKITPKMHHHIKKIIDNNSVSGVEKKKLWLDRNLPKLDKLEEMIRVCEGGRINVGFGYKLNVMLSMKESAVKWGGLTKKQMGYLNKLHEHYKPWYDKKINKLKGKVK